jgi:hypothetical protein
MPKPRLVVPATLALLAVLVLAPLPGCDREDDAPPPIVIVTPEPVRGIIAETSFSGFQTGIWVGIEVLVTTQGKLDITVDWGSEETWMFVYFGSVQCGFTELEAGNCPFMIASETKEPKPRVLFTDLIEPDTYYLYLYNVPRVPGTDIGSDVTEAVALQLGLTVGFQPRAEEEDAIHLGQPRVLAPPRL